MKFAACALVGCLLVASVYGDLYMLNPRGCNNRLNDENNNAQNQNRLFDSQNNAAGGHHWGPELSFYVNSEISFQWTNQHASGLSGWNNAELIIQYMCDPTLRDGDATQGANARQTYDPNNGDQANGNDIRGRHETGQYYLDCLARERNKGLFIADQNLNNNIGATSTRQNAGGTRYGTECPEARDYYPYWHKEPWKDLAIFTSNTSRCEMYETESQNVKNKGLCSDAQYNNAAACSAGGGTWTEDGAWGTAAPVCELGKWSRVNHLGNSNEVPNVAMQMAGNLTSDSRVVASDIGLPCVFRMRYNITTNDYDGWNTYSESNGGNSPVVNDPEVDIGYPTKLQLAINTAQFGRTFEDRSYMFKWMAAPAGVTGTIHNLNVMGRRGNIVQTYPCVEYDFVPTRLHMAPGDSVHIQWVGSDYNAANQAGEGTDQTDRHNLIQLKGNCQACNYPETLANIDFIDPADPDHDAKVTLLALVNQNDPTLNDAAPYFDGGLHQFNIEGNYQYMCTRNNNFTNRSQKGGIVVGNIALLSGGAAAAVAVGAVLVAVAGVAAGMAFYARAHPTSSIGQAFAARSLAGTGPSAGAAGSSRGSFGAGSRGGYSQKSGMTRSRGSRDGGSRGSRGSRKSAGGKSHKSKGSSGSKGTQMTGVTAFTRAQR